jgi:hypothetical protein
MEIWIEYFKRHGFPIVRPFEPFNNNLETPHIFIRETPPIEHTLWSQFVVSNRQLITTYNPNIESLIRTWYNGNLIPHNTPTMREQISLLFTNVPGLERMWNNYTNTNRVPVVRRRN